MTSPDYIYIRDFFEKVLAHYTSGQYYETLVEGKEVFFSKTGKVDEDDDEFESRMIDFNEWYIFDFIPSKVNGPLIRHYIYHNNVEQEVAHAFGHVKQSLFEFKGKSLWGSFVFEDYLYGGRVKVSKKTILPNIIKDDVFLARIINFKGEQHLLGSVVTLPRDARSIFKKAAKKARKQNDMRANEEFLLEVQRLKSKWKSYNHVDVRHIFKFST